MAALQQAYRDLQTVWEENSYPSAAQLYRLQGRKGLTFSRKQIDEWIADKASVQVLKPRREPNLVRGRFAATRPYEKMSMDLMDRWDFSLDHHRQRAWKPHQARDV